MDNERCAGRSVHSQGTRCGDPVQGSGSVPARPASGGADAIRFFAPNSVSLYSRPDVWASIQTSQDAGSAFLATERGSQRVHGSIGLCQQPFWYCL
ncbi:hypothetical protein F751_2656 [Auxenochlorella protothecoides]|uniref:Uncharacterized protein n=1 Tax=Auxenochlorella protothecoides TaxID=3075 RepID=A0A087SL34_AUXPR|nr:hypothetical protein F751_2656 [Auxenochlorella protothecoides]KFM26438.1 hypothetical protein F751_2656 [Auxenochlorella protothecoides]